MTAPFFTIGHSNRSIETFIELLQGAGIELVADIRTVPRSRANPQFNVDILPGHLAPSGIGYEHMAALGGLRGKARSLPADVNGLWENQSFHNYADYALSDRFQTGLQHLRSEGHRLRCTLMCSEAVWWQCHRRIVADYLIAAGETVFHIMERGRTEPARLTQGAIIRADGKIIYPAAPDRVSE
ncbi:MAG: DUF488 domain-containing protein [Rhizobiaceae bacterium]